MLFWVAEQATTLALRSGWRLRGDDFVFRCPAGREPRHRGPPVGLRPWSSTAKSQNFWLL